MPKWRLKLFQAIVIICLLIISGRLFYWQILSRDRLQAIAQIQHNTTTEIPATRGKILATDNFPLVGNKPAYLVYVYLPDFTADPQEVSNLLAPILAPKPEDVEATPSAKVTKQLIVNTQQELYDKLSTQDYIWLPLKKQISEADKNQIEALNLDGIGFESNQIRAYPEASMSAHLLGFVGSDANGRSKGYFGLEGYYDLELKGKPGIISQEKDPSGKPILIGEFTDISSRDGRSLKLHLNRAIQKMVEEKLVKGVGQFGAKSGEVAIMDPKTGAILALASWPAYAPENFSKFDQALYKNPLISDSYEPGSTFKVITMAAAIEEEAIKPDTKCTECSEPVEIGKFTIKTWNEEYHQDQTMGEVLERSDNVGMVFVGFKLGKDKFVEYIKKFGIGELTGIDLQEETTPSLRRRWGDIDLATGTFGQGLAVTGMQMLRAVAAIANDGRLMEPHIVSQILGDKTIDIKPHEIKKVISKETADTVTDMMVNAANHGDAQWTALKGYNIAGKTGTSQIAIKGHYDEEKTIASFVGFAPANDPKFTMIVKLKEPTTSQWASETAAPLWYSIAKDLFFYLNIPPQTQD